MVFNLETFIWINTLHYLRHSENKVRGIETIWAILDLFSNNMSFGTWDY